ncbi:pyrroline-5-carboxylate reductase [Demequina sp. NBRC 110055]|uniref:pyrroline-5-carboxylate reductase n=1 Tax=Demequina sp. NBRC 110055 TaxID=1570344 RepID=UPI000A014357|nr:pyrroline-5-carboxylate reductase [Demequina sp. NBRC 110055]
MSESTPTSPTTPRVTIIGGGVMGGTMVTALRVAGWPVDHITVVERDSARAAALAEGHGIAVGSDIAAAVVDADVIVIAVKVYDTEEALTHIAPVYRPGALIHTVVAGLTTSFYEERLPGGAPVVRSMPNTPSIIGHGATAITAGAHADEGHMALATDMLKATGLVVTVDESQMDTVTAIAGSGPAYFYAFVEALTEAGVGQGLDRELATQLAAQTFLGAARLLVDTGDTPDVLRKRVSSPGGTTIAALKALSDAGLDGVVAAGADAAAKRSRQLAEELG